MISPNHRFKQNHPLLNPLPYCHHFGVHGLLLISIFLFFPTFVSISTAQEQESISWFVEANQAYENQDFALAANLYESLIQSDHRNGHLYYNLGNTYYRLGSLGKAIGYYLQALHYLPRHEDLIANLKYARQQTTDQKENQKQSWREIFQEWSSPLTLKEWLLFLIICNSIFWGVSVFRLFYRVEMLSWLIFLSGGLTLFFTTGSLVKWWAPLPVGAILPQESALYAAPHQQATVLFQLHEGTEVTIEDEAEQWMQIRFEPTQKGWIEKKNLFLVYPQGRSHF